MSFDSIAPARALINLLRLAGFWHNSEIKRNTAYRLYSVFIYTTLMVTLFLAMFTNMAVSLENYEQLTEGLYMTLTMLTSCLKCYFFLANARSVRELLENFANEPNGVPQTPAELAIISTEFQAFSRLRNAYLISIVVVFTIADISGLITQSLPFPCWFPFDYQTLPNFYFAYWYVTVGIAFSSLTTGTVDLSVCFLMFQVANLNKLLAHRLEQLQGAGDLYDGKLNLKELIQFHKFIVEMTTKSEEVISVPVMVQICMSTFVICFAAFRLNTMRFSDDPSTFMVLFIFSLVISLQIYLPCSYGNELSHSAENLMHAIYNCNWYDLPLHTQKDIYIYMEYLRQPVKVRAGKFFEIGLPIFTAVMSNAYRLYALLMNIGQ